MTIAVISISQKSPDWVSTGFQAYANRCPHPWNLEHHQVPLAKRSANQPSKAILKESDQVLKLLRPNDLVIGLDPTGEALDSYSFADKIHQALCDSRRPVFIIGAPEGLSSEVKQACHHFFSFGAMTMAHTLIKVVLAEQIFRAWSIIHKHPYHRQ